MKAAIIRSAIKFVEKTGTKDVLRSFYYAWQDLFDPKDILRRNEILRDRYSGQRIFLLATGPSLLEIAPDKLKTEYTMPTSYLPCPEIDARFTSKYGEGWWKEKQRWNIPGCYLKGLETDPDIERHLEASRNRDRWPGFKNLNATFYPPSGLGAAYEVDNVRRLALDKWQAIVNAYPNAILFVEASERKWMEEHKFLDGKEVYYVKTAGQLKNVKKVENDLTRRNTIVSGTFNFMIGASIYMGFKEIYLCGFGGTYKPNQPFNFYFNPAFPKDFPKQKMDQIINRIMRIETNYKVSGFYHDDKYIRPIWVYHTPISDTHLLMREFADAHGVKIYNIVPDFFQSPVFEKVSWGYVEKNVLSA